MTKSRLQLQHSNLRGENKVLKKKLNFPKLKNKMKIKFQFLELTFSK